MWIIEPFLMNSWWPYESTFIYNNSTFWLKRGPDPWFFMLIVCWVLVLPKIGFVINHTTVSIETPWSSLDQMVDVIGVASWVEVNGQKSLCWVTWFSSGVRNLLSIHEFFDIKVFSTPCGIILAKFFFLGLQSCSIFIGFLKLLLPVDLIILVKSWWSINRSNSVFRLSSLIKS